MSALLMLRVAGRTGVEVVMHVFGTLWKTPLLRAAGGSLRGLRLPLLVLGALVAVALAGPVRSTHADNAAAEPGAVIGAAAPAFRGVTWLKKGPAHKTPSAERVTLVVLWGTWCTPAIATLPDLARLAEAHAGRGLDIVLLSDDAVADQVAWLAASPRPGAPSRLSVMPFSLATDETGAAIHRWMGVRAPELPHAFVVGTTGHVEWRGHVMRSGPVLNAVLDGSWNRTLAREDRARRAERERVSADLVQVTMKAHAAGDPQLLVDAVAKVIANDPTWRAMRMRQVVLLWAENDRVEEGRKAATALTELAWGDAQTLNELAWFVVDDPRVQTRDLEVAKRAATRAVVLTNEAQAAILDTMARVYFELGQLEDALAWQRKAVAAAKDVDEREPLEEVLAKYARAVAAQEE